MVCSETEFVQSELINHCPQCFSVKIAQAEPELLLKIAST